MAASSRAIHVGVIAEERNDVDVLYALTAKVVKENAFKFSHFVGQGCGKLHRKCEGWGKVLLRKGCTVLVVIHDRDGNDESVIRTVLASQVSKVGFTNNIVLIPKEEIEAWLLCDPDAIKTVFRMGTRPSVPSSPESVVDPKKHLSRIVRAHSNSEYLNTVHNQKIAAAMDLGSLGRCPSFNAYPTFLKSFFPRRVVLGASTRPKRTVRRRRPK